MTGLVEVVGDRFLPVVFDVSQVFIETGVKLASSFADVEFGALISTLRPLCFYH